ncbi:LuxR C-terminal-related transcriptional regulator [Sinomonas sp. JGH33]|uniref:LuxR C-terminal-related transcriptional regulator n=1 Tax=Sinomonas terricola TaxID=3110330 RepID=A0ABU5T0P4_9MICC|nr:AAA family ATPase [Sinomonas sp. JGH33]MEA5453117.1 LuxR C-terminal-related transcriptional regulator [Sinomonas sp. JGH33]
MRELSAMSGCLRDAMAGTPRFVLLEGEGGTGKTALLQEFAAAQRGVQLAWATGDEAETVLSYGLLNQLRARLPRPEAGTPRTEGNQDPFAQGAALLQELGEAQRAGPVLLVVDDAHLVDRSSLAALTFALRRLRNDQVMTVLATRESGVEHLPAGLLRLAQDQGTRLTLRGLTVAEISELAEATGFGRISVPAAARLREHTGGHALYLRALLAEVGSDQIEALDVPLPAPRSLALTVLAGLRETSAEAQRLAAACAVLGPGATPFEIARIGGVVDPLPAIEELQRLALVVAEDHPDGRRIGFAHPLLRAAVYDDLGLATRAALHVRAASMKSGREALRHRVAAASEPDPGLVAALREQAGADREIGAWEAAAEALFAAARLSQPGPARDRLWVDGIELLLADGDVPSAQMHLRQLASRREDPHALQLSARICLLLGDLGAAAEQAGEAWRLARQHDPGARDSAAGILALLCLLRNDGDGAAMWAERALLSGLLPPEAASPTRAIYAFGRALAGRADDGLRILAEVSDVPSHRPEIDVRGFLRLWTDDIAGALADLRSVDWVEGFGRGRGQDIFHVAALSYLAETNFRLGDWDAAWVTSEHAVSLVEDTGQIYLLAQAHAMATLVPAARGRWDEAERHLELAVAAAEANGDAPSRCYADNAAVHLAACRADPRAVVGRAQWLLTDGPGGTHEPGFYSWPIHFVSALVQLGRFEEAAVIAERYEAVARLRGRRSRLAGLARVRGELAAARRDTATARALFEESIRLGDGSVDALEAATARASYGRFLRRRGERRGAVEQLGMARAMFASLGADPFVQRCDAELAACGHSRGSGPGAMVPELTPQELAVARLVSAGRTNREAAQELVLSVKTVGYHLGNVYAKLGVRSRTELAARLGNRA